MSYLNSVTIIGFVGADLDQRQARNNKGSKFTVLSVATQRSWKNSEDEWASTTAGTMNRVRRGARIVVLHAWKACDVREKMELQRALEKRQQGRRAPNQSMCMAKILSGESA